MSFAPTAILNTEIKNKESPDIHRGQPIDNKYFSHNPCVMNILQTSTPCKPLNTSILRPKIPPPGGRGGSTTPASVPRQTRSIATDRVLRSTSRSTITRSSLMAIPEDLAAITRQEAELRFQRFDHDTAWRLGVTLRELALARNQSVVIDIRRLGLPYQPLFYTALPGTTPDNPRWVQRKSNVVARFHRSSYQVGLHLQNTRATFSEKYALPDADYATHGGSFPIHVTGTGVIGSVTVSGLPQREDHNLAVEGISIKLLTGHHTPPPPTKIAD